MSDRDWKAHFGQPTWDRLVARISEVNRDIHSRGIRSFQRRSDLLSGYSYDEFYDWDLYFENIYLSHFGVSRYCRTNLEVFLERQLACGFVSRTLVDVRHRQHFKPFLAQIALLGARQELGFRWIDGTVYERLQKYLDYWFWYCDYDRNGLCVWDSADHSGMDNQDRRAGSIYESAIEGVDLNCYLVRELQAMSQIAAAIGRPADASAFQQRAADLSDLINEVFWDENEGFYFDRHEREGRLVRVKSIAGFIPLWLGIVPKDRLKRVVHDHLLNPAEFWRPYPIAAWSKTEPDYYQEPRNGECNWRGTTWVPTNYMVFQGLRRQGQMELAKELAYKTFDMALAEETTREYYNADTGSGLGLDPFWGWTALAYLMPMEYEASYDPTEIGQNRLIPLAAQVLGIRFPTAGPS